MPTKSRTIRNRLCSVYALLFYIISVSFFVYFKWDYVQIPSYVYVNKDVNSKCVLPRVDVNDPTIMKYYNWDPPPIQCDKTPSVLLVDDKGMLDYNPNATKKTGGKLDYKCTYSVIKLTDDYHVTFLPEVAFTPPVSVDSDVFFVRCKNKDSQVVYEQLHYRIYPKGDYRNAPNDSPDKLSVVMMGVDSVSRLAALRKLPKTVDYLKNVLDAYIFEGFNKVGDNTFPVLVSMFTGKFFHEWHLDTHKHHVDELPLIWKNFSAKDYVTMYAEDWPEIATFSHSMSKGFRKQPTDHYMRPFWLAMRQLKPMQHDADMIFQFLESQNLKLTKASTLCYGNQKNHMIPITYYKQFLTQYKGKLKYAFGWLNEIGHNFVNFIGLGDNDFYEFLKWMYEGKHLENSMLIFFSDHGSRTDLIRNTYVGRIEDRMPFVSIVTPKHFKKRFPRLHENMLRNTKKLTTSFDVFKTLKEVVDQTFTSQSDQSYDPKTPNKPYSFSLFREIPKDRSCLDANIPEHYCVCYSSQTVDDKEKPLLANFVLNAINSKMKTLQHKCATLKLNKISDAQILKNNLERKQSAEAFTYWKYFFSPEERRDTLYRVTIETLPGYGLFEATIKKPYQSTSLQVVDQISRINSFGNQTRCMTDRSLRDYCYCF